MTEVDCPWDGCDYTSNERGVKLHHKMTHGESIRGVEITCENCGTTKRRPEADIKGHTFCSPECHNEWQTGRFTGEDSPSWEGGKIEITCTYCGNTKDRIPSALTDSENNFCNEDCFFNWVCYNGINSGENNPLYVEDIKDDCDYCGGDISVVPSRYELCEKHFCDDLCYADWMSENAHGKNSNAWDGGAINYYGEDWDNQRKYARQRDNHLCQHCGLKAEKHISEFGQTLHVHHIIPFKYFGFENHETANKLNNLVTLCSSCHKSHEKWSENIVRNSKYKCHQNQTEVMDFQTNSAV